MSFTLQTSLSTVTRRLSQISFNNITKHSTNTNTACLSVLRNVQLPYNNNDGIKYHNDIGIKKHFSSSSNENSNENQLKQEWSNFQQSVFVADPRNIQSSITSSSTKKKKNRGGKALRLRREAEYEAQMKSSSQLSAGGGQYPALRYSDDETQKLLDEAYTNIPPRTGKRGTRNLKRQSNRWFAVRKARAVKKQEKMNHHFDKMEKRGRVKNEVLEVKNTAEGVREGDREYQMNVLIKWASMKGLIPKEKVME